MSVSLYELRRKMERKKLLDKVLEDLTQQQKELEQQLVSLRAFCRREDEDVLRLEGHSFASLFYAVIGQKTEKLEKERAEACAAMAKSCYGFRCGYRRAVFGSCQYSVIQSFSLIPQYL